MKLVILSYIQLELKEIRIYNVRFILIMSILTYNLFSQQSKLSGSVNEISEFIASEKFIDIKNEYGELQAVDSVFYTALRICDSNFSETLLALTFTTVPYREVPIQMPLSTLLLYYPLISADNGTYLKKNDNLPRYIFFDSPPNNYGDKDKLAHFFGSAYLSYASNIFDLGNLIGYFVEVFEEKFKVQSEIDERDLFTNRLGNLFGKVIKRNKNAQPSQILIMPTLFHFRFNI